MKIARKRVKRSLFKRFCLTYKIDEKYGEKNYNLLFSHMIKYSPSVSCDINNGTAIVKTCSVKITAITNSFKDICINKPPLPTDVFDDVNTILYSHPPCIDTTDIDDIERFGSYSLKDIAKCSTLPCENILTYVLLGDKNLNNIYIYMSRDTQASWRLVPSFILKNISTPLELVIQNVIATWILCCCFRFLEKFIISSLVPVRKVPYQNVYLKQHIVHPVLQMWMPSNFDWYNILHSTVAKFNRIVQSASWC